MIHTKRYKHIFFDLDRTLWDFDKNSAETLQDIIRDFRLQELIKDRRKFISVYNKHNDRVWHLYRNKEITKAELRVERFRRTLSEFKLNDLVLAKKISNYYINNSPNKGHLIEHACEILDYLRPSHSLYIVSNGFYDTQVRKLKTSGIDKYFKMIFTSDRIGAAKPNKLFFQYALSSSNAKKAESLVIGDDFTNDIMGAKNFGLDQLWFNPDNISCNVAPTFETTSLAEIKNIL